MDSEAGVRPAGGNGGRDGEVRVLLGAEAAQRVVREGGLGEQAVNVPPRTGALLPVDEARTPPRHVREAGQRFGLPGEP